MRGLILGGALACALIATVALSGCTSKEDPVQKDPAASSGLPAELMLSAAPAGAKPLGEVKQSAKQGDEITFVARVGGTLNPFIDGRATMVVIDPSLDSCADMGDDDHCSTPWDYCCEPRDSLTANSATVQIVGADGKPLPLGLKGQSGIEELVTITVVGTVAEKNEEGLMIVNASGVHVKKG